MSPSHTPAPEDVAGRYLILGGVRSGKSVLAEQALQTWTSGPGKEHRAVHYVATAQAGDGEMAERIRHHQARRPSQWGLIEEPLALASVLQSHDEPGQALLIDCMSLWVSNLLHAGEDTPEREQAAFLTALATYSGVVVIVSNEVGLGLVGMDPLSRRFADTLGRLNQSLARRCDHVWMSVAGLPMGLKGEAPPGC